MSLTTSALVKKRDKTQKVLPRFKKSADKEVLLRERKFCHGNEVVPREIKFCHGKKFCREKERFAMIKKLWLIKKCCPKNIKFRRERERLVERI